ncbi:MAG TPA: hypothetical protein VF183_03955, partial [Acidimicrobiales bacterium]
GRRVLSSRVLRGAMSVAPSIREWQLVRHPRHFELRILADGGLSRAGRELVTRGVARTLDATVPVRVSDAAPSRISNGELREAIDARTEISLRDVQRMAERSIDVCHQRTQQEALT